MFVKDNFVGENVKETFNCKIVMISLKKIINK